MRDFKDKIVGFYKEKQVPILVCALAVLIVILVFVLLLGAGDDSVTLTKYQQWMIQLKEKDIAVCEYDSINDFFDDYYEALSSGDTTALEGMVDDADNANITTELSSIVESYSNITVYITPGINSDEVLAFVSYDIYFENISSAAPAVDSFYIKMDSDTNSIYIMTEMYTDADINTFMYLASYREPVKSLFADAESELNAILEEDSELRNIYIIMNAMAEENSESETDSEEETQEESSEDEEEAETETETESADEE